LPLLVTEGKPPDRLLPDVWASQHPEHPLAERQKESRQARHRCDRTLRRAAMAAAR
jgi:hypothetical protein